ncbi:MAG TPA: hypothetical protein VFU29_19175 [Chitinophagaceae bacterium]|nr:hypothetical protein [Chitinophagaceae bacterium]
MEVHHHAHTERKKWTHYLWEFIMLFLAVFCGFLAENQREHYIEHQREKQYMRSLLEDLQTDTATITRVHSKALAQVSFLDSLTESGNHIVVNADDINRIYFLQGNTTRFLNIHFEDGTSSQLKNAGGMRLIRKEGVAKAIREYWDHVETLYRVRDRLEMVGENIANVSSRIFYNKYFVPGKEPLDPPIEIKSGAAFIDNDPKLMAEYINRVASKLLRTKVYMTELESAIQVANRLMGLIKEEYHLK